MVNDVEMALVFSFAKKMSQKLSYGVNIKMIRKSTGEYKAWGLGFDAGVLFNPVGSLNLGAVLCDGTSTLLAWNGGRRELILPLLKVGAAYSYTISSFKLLPVFDVQLGFENRGSATQVSWGRMDIDLRTGMEVAFRDRVAVRFGIDRGHFTTGAGVRVSAFCVDY